MTSEQRQVWHAAAIALIVAALLYERHHHTIRATLARLSRSAPRPAAPPATPGPPWTVPAGESNVYPLASDNGPRGA